MTKVLFLDVSDRARVLAGVPLFDACSPAHLEEIATRAQVLSFADGEVIVPEGEEGLGFYVILSGAVVVTRRGLEIARLTGGDFFGEISIIERLPRTATVTASGPTTCAGFLRSAFRPLLAKNPRLALRILEAERVRMVDSNDATEPDC